MQCGAVPSASVVPEHDEDMNPDRGTGREGRWDVNDQPEIEHPLITDVPANLLQDQFFSRDQLDELSFLRLGLAR